jgi:rsbT co-antagonist protein RsbR
MTETLTTETMTRILERAPGGAWAARIVPPAGRLEWIYASARTAALHGVTEAEMRAEPMALLRTIAPDARGRFDAALARCVETLAPLDITGSVTRPDGEVRWIQTQIAFERDADGSVVAYGQTLDVTEQRRLSEELRRQSEKLLESEQAKAALIERLRHAVDELENPILEVWKSVLAMPIIGVVDSRRAADMSQRLLSEVARAQAAFVIIDLTGVDVVDTKTADHLMKLVRKVELIGARCVLTGLRPSVAETLVDIGVDLSQLTTLRNLEHGLREALRFIRRAQEGPDL